MHPAQDAVGVDLRLPQSKKNSEALAVARSLASLVAVLLRDHTVSLDLLVVGVPCLLLGLCCGVSCWDHLHPFNSLLSLWDRPGCPRL